MRRFSMGFQPFSYTLSLSISPHLEFVTLRVCLHQWLFAVGLELARVQEAIRISQDRARVESIASIHNPKGQIDSHNRPKRGFTNIEKVFSADRANICFEIVFSTHLCICKIFKDFAFGRSYATINMYNFAVMVSEVTFVGVSAQN